MRNVALTGSSGMTGKYMNMLLEKKHFNVINVDRTVWDLTQWKSFGELDQIFLTTEAIFHFGAVVPQANNNFHEAKHSLINDIFDANIRACACLAEWALSRDVPVVFLSGATVYKDPHALNITEDADKTTNSFGGFYGFSKYMAEQMFDHFISNGLKSILLRPSSIYGTGMVKERLVAKFVGLAVEGKIIEIIEPVNNSVNFIHASDVALAALLAFEKQAWGTFNIAANKNISLNELANKCIELAGRGSVEVINNKVKTKPFVRFDLNCNKARNQFGFESKVDIENGIKAMLENTIDV